MAEKVKGALASLRAARSGEKRTDQYTVKVEPKILQSVSESEYRSIVEQRRDDFVVGDSDLGYQDAGKEIWDDGEALREAKELAPKTRGAAGAKKAAKESAPPEKPKETLIHAFHAGVSSGAAGSAASAEVPSAPVISGQRSKDLDDMMDQMCMDIDEVPEPAAAQGGRKGKRKGEAAGAAGPAKKPAVRKAKGAAQPESTAMAVDDAGDAPVKREPAAAAESVKVKSEPSDEPASVLVKEPAPAPPQPEGDAVAVKQEPAEELQSWLQDADAAAAPAAVAGKLQVEPDGSCWFFFTDAFEDDRSSPPRLYLFGKVRAEHGHQSCCLVVESVERAVHLLLSGVQDMDDAEHVQQQAAEAEAEFDSLSQGQGVKKLRAKLKWRNYAFEKALPTGPGHLPFLKVVCDSSGRMPSPSVTGSSFSHIFGAQTSMLERVILSRGVQGPSWLRLQPGSFREDAARLSWCATELRITPAAITVAKSEEDKRALQEIMPKTSPPLRVMSLSMQTTQKSVQQPHEPVAIACTMHPNVSPDAMDSEKDLREGMTHWKALRRIDSAPLPRDSEKVLGNAGVHHFTSESALLLAFLAKVQEFDPDVIAGHNAFGFDLDVLASRMGHLKLQGWQRLGRLRRQKDRIPRIEGRSGTAGFWVGQNMTAGRLVCDVVLHAKDMLPKLGQYDLPTLAREQLGDPSLKVVEPEQLSSYFHTAPSLAKLAMETFHSALCVARLMHSLQVLPLTKQLTNIAGNTWNSSLQNKRAERNEMYLCREFHRRKFVCPDKESLLAKKRRMGAEGGAALANGLDDAEDAAAAAPGAGPRRGKAAYSGGLVLEPKVGLYDDFVMMLDFNSLYPSIIQEHNICFLTVERPTETEVAGFAGEAELLAKTRPPDGTETEGVLPQVLRYLVDSRRTVKNAMKSEKDPRRLQTLEIRQRALKLTANSMYGCLGFQNSRFYSKPLAALITAKGREALMTTITVVQQELQLDVVYGDTDSVFVNTKTQVYEEAMAAGQQIKRSVNKRYKRLEIEIDAIFGRLILMKKKKYAALKVVDWEKRIFEKELKGLDIVRRDWCGLAKSMGDEILTKVLNCVGKEEAVNWAHEYLAEKAKALDAGEVPLREFVITKGLTKDPKDYPDAKNQPHVQVALRLQARGKAVRAGQEVEYVICQVSGEGPKALLADRARHPLELKQDESLKVDFEWYKRHQIHPLVSRTLAPVEGTDAARIAECLGMDGSRFAQAAAALGGGDPHSSYVSSASADVNALFDRRLRWKSATSGLPGAECLKCRSAVSWKQLLQPEEREAGGVGALFQCSGCGEHLNPRRAQNLLTVQIRGLLREHCEGWVQCPDDPCVEKTRRAHRGRNMVDERMVLRELEYVEHLCDTVAECPGDDLRRCRDAAADMKKTVQRLLDCNGNNWVNCGQVFAGIFGAAR